MARKSFLAILLGGAAFAVPNAVADKGGVPHQGSQGQGRSAVQQKAATAPHGQAYAKGHAKTHATAQGKALAKGHATVSVQAMANGHAIGHSKAHGQAQAHTPTGNTHAKAGKTTICHAAGSATNPFVRITISNNALPAHRRHQDGRDIIPAPEGSCVTAQASQTPPPGENVPPTGTTPQEQAPAAPTTGTSTTGVTPSGAVQGESVSGGGAPSNGQVLGATVTNRAPSASASPAATTTRPASSSKLPFTGTDAILFGILGLAALLVGVTARRASRVSGTRG